ncbi:hypothetical protein ACFQRL_12540 [Microbacterium fluvii]|uniref:Uncharacterized protein n=1 Tax=Microbacterium fluvii TaxID=415215 RepID=A0ABW2HIY5_9MICO|nr:hypothetical protein [Microbacterium fluvii]MCU4673425.1 hypothetical protein [Microbacterium fluvii]
MPGNKRLSELTDYTAVLPYASELFGVYQPLLGWKSKRMAARFDAGFARDRRRVIDSLAAPLAPRARVTYNEDGYPKIDLHAAEPVGGRTRRFDERILQLIADRLPPWEEYRPEAFDEVITREAVEELFARDVAPLYEELGFSAARGQNEQFAAVVRTDPRLAHAALEERLAQESRVAGAVLQLREGGQIRQLESIFYAVHDDAERFAALVRLAEAAGPLEGLFGIDTLDPQSAEQLRRVALSPISVVHLFRQYFFELDSFLGTPVGHVWLSPGSTVELIEVSTRRTLVERVEEFATETTIKSESERVEEDELSEAVKTDNKQDVKFGASVTASYASITANSSFDFATTQQTAREETHKRMRRQTEKLSSEIRKNYKSTFRTVTETTDTSSKRYLLTNSGTDLVNYELRRKMRQVAVQVQDVGTYLCWQTYVDRPGETLGVAELLHIAKPPELDGLHAPAEVPMLKEFPETRQVTIPFISINDSDADNEGEVYRDGGEVDDSEFAGSYEQIQSDFDMEFVCSRSGYVLADVEFDGLGKPVTASRKGDISNAGDKAKFVLHLDSVDFQGQNSVQVQLTLHWAPAPGANTEAIEANKKAKAEFKAKEAAEYQKAYLQNARDRVKLTHAITSRPSEELREEERIVVYRKLIQELLTAGVPQPDDRTRHVVAELINSIFDVDKMLYFVAPEWWRPRLRRTKQQLGPTPSGVAAGAAGGGGAAATATIASLARGFGAVSAFAKPSPLSSSTVGWGGAGDVGRDNYFITEDSRPARFGSSLGWLLQLDGDNLRNAFLNAPWVKAVIPIRPGKEEAAINWLTGVEGMNGIGDDDRYETSNPDEKDIDGNPLDGQPLLDVIHDLGAKVRRKHEEAVSKGTFPKASEVADPQLVDEDNVVTSTPIDRVYEHGFFPLQGGFRANVSDDYEVFDQWLEIVPTDQVVPVEVSYDPKTGRQL